MDLEIRRITIEENEADNEKRRILEELIALSAEWADENLCPGYYANDASEYYGKELYIARAGGKTVGYLLGHIKTLEEETSYNAVGEKAFELDELFVTKELRSEGIGGKLFRFMEEEMNGKADVIGLTAASNEYNKLLKFYIDGLGMRFNHALLVKRIK